MRIRLVLAMLCGSVLCGSSGCRLVKYTKEVFTGTPNPMIDRAPIEDEEDEWATVGRDGRGNMTREKDPDPWWKKYVMSEQARNIERNVGID